MATSLLLIGAVVLLMAGALLLVRRSARAVESMSQEEFLERIRNLQ